MATLPRSWRPGGRRGCTGRCLRQAISTNRRPMDTILPDRDDDAVVAGDGVGEEDAGRNQDPRDSWNLRLGTRVQPRDRERGTITILASSRTPA